MRRTTWSSAIRPRASGFRVHNVAPQKTQIVMLAGERGEKMFKLHVVQAEYGDCLILECGTGSKSTHILVDGGPAGTYQRHLRKLLGNIKERGGRLDLTILSHVDDDHVAGLLELMTDLQEQSETVKISALWHNAFSQTIGSGIETRLGMRLAAASTARRVMTMTDSVTFSIRQGDQLKSAATALGIPINSGFSNDLVSLDGAPHQPIEVGDLRLYVVGPTKKSLGELEKKWDEWLRKYRESRLVFDPILASKVDRSIPNLSSIMVVAEMEGKRVLLAGDGLCAHLIKGLGQVNLLRSDGTFHVDVLKVPHHGSVRNVSRDFFKKVTADKYVISANGEDGNPDLATLIWIVEAAKDQRRTIEILVTNETSSTRQLVEEYDPDKYGYRLIEMDKESDSMPLQIEAEESSS